jgi:antitoxin component YwqK of YwqJK toxin-antitoxin module
MKRVPHSEVDYPGDGYYYHDDKRFTGVDYILNEDEGWVEAETEYVEGLPSGLAREWAGPDRDKLLCEAQIRGGVVHGRKRRWTEDGTLIEDGEYEYGIALWEKKWDEDGDLIENYELKESDPNYARLLKRRQIEKEQAEQRESST